MANDQSTCKGYKCSCQKFVPGEKQGVYIACANPECNHVGGTHGDYNKPAAKTVVVNDEPTVKAKPVKTTVSSVGELSIGEMRILLRKNGIAVGERGRLSPEQKAKALSLVGK